MTDAEELRTVLAVVRAPGRKKGLFSRGGKGSSGKKRLDAARRLAELVVVATVDADVIEALEIAALEFPTDESVRLAFARALAAAGRPSEAITEFEEHLRSCGDDAGALCMVAALYEATGRSDLAVQRLERAVDVFVKAGDLDAAAHAARSLITLEPQSLERASELVSMLKAREPALLADALAHLADVYRDRGKLGQEADACRDLLALAPERTDFRQRLAVLYTRILEVDPDDVDAWSGIESADPFLALALRERLQPAGAPDVQAAEPLPSDEPHLAYATRKAQELILAGDILGASLCLERAAQDGPDPGTRLRLARCYKALHRDTEAARQALRAIALGCSAGDGAALDEALGWLVELHPDAGGPIGDAVFLNQRPESADMLYEVLLQCWDDIETPRDAAPAGTSE